MRERERLVIVGGNAAGMAAATSARRCRPDLDITLIEQSSRIAAATCSIPAYLEGRFADVSALENLTPKEASEKYQLNILTHHQAVEIQPRNHLLQVRNCQTNQIFAVPYYRLILATGARPAKPRTPNVSARGVFTLRSLNDAEYLRRFIERRRPSRFAIIGTGTIAQVCAAALSSYGMDIFLVGRDARLVENLEEPISKRILRELNNYNIEVYITDNDYDIQVSLDNEIKSIEIDGKIQPCDGILVAIGVEPNVDLAVSASLELGVHRTIKIDRHLTTSMSGIYACGDCAHTYFKLNHKPIYWPLASTGSRQGRQAGAIAAGCPGEDPGTLAARIWTCFDLQVARVGYSSEMAKAAGIKARTTHIKALSKRESFGGAEIDLVIVSAEEDGRILGAQLAGTEGVQARFNTLCAAIAGKLTLSDLEHLDLAYTPELSNLWDPVHIAARLGQKRL